MATFAERGFQHQRDRALPVLRAALLLLPTQRDTCTLRHTAPRVLAADFLFAVTFSLQ